MVGSGHGGGGRPNDDDHFFQPNIHWLLFFVALLSSSADWLLDVLVEETQALRVELHSPDTVKESDGRFVLWVGYTVGVVRALWRHPWSGFACTFHPVDPLEGRPPASLVCPKIAVLADTNSPVLNVFAPDWYARNAVFSPSLRWW